MTIMTIHIEDILGPQVQHQLERPLDGLQPGAQLFFQHEKNERLSTHIRISHPEAPHSPSYNILWITDDGRFMVIAPIRIDPDSYDEPSIRVLVKLSAPNAIEVLPPAIIAEKTTSLRKEIEKMIDRDPATFDSYLTCQVAKFLTRG